MNAKKISGLAVLALFLFSLVPVALAEETTEPSTAGEQVKAKVKEPKPLLKKVNQELVEAKNRFQEAKEKYLQVKEKYMGAKEKADALRKEIKECKKDNETCDLKKKEYRKEAKQQLVHLADVILKNLDKLKEKISAAEKMEEAERSELLAKVDEQIAEVEKAKAVLGNTSGEVTEEELKEAVKTVKEAWQKTKKAIKVNAGRLINSQLGHLITQIEKLEAKFEKIRDRLKEKGSDVTSLDLYLGKLNEKLAAAKENWEKAKEKFKEAHSATDAEGLVQEAHQYQQKARELVKDARKEIRELVKAIKELGKTKVNETSEAAQPENTPEENETTE